MNPNAHHQVAVAGDRAAPPSADPWPEFVVIGMAKAGSTSLGSYLRQHPQIYMSPTPTPNFFGLGEQPPPVYAGPGLDRLINDIGAFL